MQTPTIRPTCRGLWIVGAPAMKQALEILDRVASSSCTVLITGESGTGKELAVAALHDASPRAHMPLVAVNCGAIPENLVESELFGHTKGAFTGAAANKPGLVAAASGGTLFLDEVGELPLAVQVKLLRLLQSKEYTVVGDTKVVRSDVRIVAATNRDLAKEVQKGTFREDLYYRLNVIHVELPPLRRRREDIAALARHFLRTTAERVGRTSVVDFSPEAMAQIVAAEWPGNVRALENTVERAVLLSYGPIVEADLVSLPTTRRASVRPPSLVSVPPPPVVDGRQSIDLRATVDAFETQILLKVLESVQWNRSRAARMLGIQRTTLLDMIRRKGLAPVKRVA